MDMQNKAIGYKSIGVRFLAALIKIYEARGVQVEKLLSKNKTPVNKTNVTDDLCERSNIAAQYVDKIHAELDLLRGYKPLTLVSANDAGADVKRMCVDLKNLGLNNIQIAVQLNKRGYLYTTKMCPKGIPFTAQHVSLIIHGRMYWENGKFVSCMRDKQTAKRNREYRIAKENSNKIETLYKKSTAERIRNPHNK
jgi:hypothetical protein